MTWYSGDDLYRIASHMLGALAAAPQDDRHDLIGDWAKEMEGDQQAWLVAAALNQALVALDSLGRMDPLLQQAIDQALASGLERVGPLPTSYHRPDTLPEQ